MSEPNYSGPERRITDPNDLAGEVRELRDSNDILASRVAALTGEFGKVNQVLANQQEIDRKSAEAVENAAFALREAKEVRKTSQTKEDADAAARELALAVVSEKRATRRRVWSIVAAIGAVLAIIFFYTQPHFDAQNSKLRSQQQALLNDELSYANQAYDACTTRSKQISDTQAGTAGTLLVLNATTDLIAKLETTVTSLKGNDTLGPVAAAQAQAYDDYLAQIRPLLDRAKTALSAQTTSSTATCDIYKTRAANLVKEGAKA